MTIRRLRSFFAPQQVLVLGLPQDESQQRLFDNLARSLPPERRALAGGAAPGWRSDAESGAELAVVLDPAQASGAVVQQLAARGCRALIWPRREAIPEAIWAAARPTTLRVLGPRATGTCDTRLGLNLSSLSLMPDSGNVALIAQSRSVAAAAVDWVVGRRVGLSWLAVSGGETDVDIADLLDYAALDPQTRAVALQLGRIRGARKFMSAARAVARVKPVAVLQTQPLRAPRLAESTVVRSAAFARAGLVECTTLGGLFDAIAALERLPVPAGGRVAVVGNGAGACALAADALLRQGLQLVPLAEDTTAALEALDPQLRLAAGTVDLGPGGAVLTVNALLRVLQAPEADAVLYVHAPDARVTHEAMAAALVAAGLRERLLTVWLGLETALPARALAARHGIATFPSADEAARALRYRRQHGLTRELLMQTPPPEAPGQYARRDADARVAAALARGESELAGEAAAALLAAYDLPTLATPAQPLLQLRADTHAELGVYLSVAPVAEELVSRPAIGFPPLDALLARRMLLDAGFAADAPALRQPGVVEALMRVGQLLIDQRPLSQLSLRLARDAQGRIACLADAVATLTATPRPERERLALAPYPAALEHRLALRDGRGVSVRAVRASDEPAAIAFLQRLDPEEIRLRFFHYIRNFTHDMAARMTQVDYDRELALVAVPDEAPQTLIAMATLVADPDGAEAEFALLVHRAWSGLGLGRHLLRALLQTAQQRGIRCVFGEVLAENQPMLGLARSLGFGIAPDADDPGCMQVRIALR